MTTRGTSPRSLLDRACARLAKVAGVASVSEPADYREPGASDGIGMGVSALIVNNWGHTFKITVTLQDLGGEG